MSFISNIIQSVEEDIETSRGRFMACINTDENADYRRGFLAGELVARLHFRCALQEMINASTQQPTD